MYETVWIKDDFSYIHKLLQFTWQTNGYDDPKLECIMFVDLCCEGYQYLICRWQFAFCCREREFGVPVSRRRGEQDSYAKGSAASNCYCWRRSDMQGSGRHATAESRRFSQRHQHHWPGAPCFLIHYCTHRPNISCLTVCLTFWM